MSLPQQIGGIEINSISFEQLKLDVDTLNAISEPTASVIEKSNNEFNVNIFTHLPATLKVIQSMNSAFKVNENIWVRYDGLLNISTPITSHPPGIPCRSFEVVYEAQEPNPSVFILYKISFDYSITTPESGVEAEAIFVRNNDLDPRTSRGTVTTIRQEK
ncbi:hypothetical protein [Flavivirga eckloniae]|uniref:Uncharacterized protein n=1 Tax=Flavivirga eckloniae TaxID=1803846 RepID=A0A2K9PNI8_9FLAO|nr:hypothetical protein [Flavivirga eckloniae]AUP78596.1 hypothetical protein C1H87_07675 [Flavivirga eckloniae]